MKAPVVIVLCPACNAPLSSDEDLEVGDCVVCDQCDEACTVIDIDPIALELDEEDADELAEDDDELEDEDEDLDELDEDEEDELDDEEEDD